MVDQVGGPKISLTSSGRPGSPIVTVPPDPIALIILFSHPDYVCVPEANRLERPAI